MNLNYQEFYQWKWSKDTNVSLVFLWIIFHCEGLKVECSLRTISSDTGVSLQGVRTAISKMINDGVITQDSTHQKSIITIYRFVDYTKARGAKPTHKSTQQKIDLVSFVDAAHLDKWNEWIKYRSTIRKQFASTSTAKANYYKLIEMSTVTVTDYNGVSEKIVDTDKLNAIIDNTIANQYQGLVPPKNYGYSNSNNTGRTNQRTAEQIAAQHVAEAAQSGFNAEQRKAEIRASLGLLG